MGVPRVLVSRSSLRRATATSDPRRGRAGGYGHVFAFADGDLITIETSGKQDRLLEGPPHRTPTRVRDTRADRAASLGGEHGPARPAAGTLLAQRPPQTPQDLMEIMRDHHSGPQSICQHPEPAEGEEAAALLFSMIAEPGTRRMWVRPGNPCENEYEEIDLTSLTDGTH